MEKKYLREIIGNNIREMRIARNMSIEELAGIMGFTSSLMGQIERGTRGTTAFMLYNLSQVLETSINALCMPAEEAGLFIADDGETGEESYQRKIASLVSNLSERELIFLIDLIKDVKKMNREGSWPEDNDDMEAEFTEYV
jgi:transcriptional regulator with XRE-family HTH domain